MLRRLTMMEIGKLGNRLKIALRIVLARRRIRHWQQSAAGTLAPVLAALAATLRFRMSAPERTWIRRIEALRRQLLASDRIIERRFFGLPAEGSPEPAGLLQEGVVVSEPIATTCRRASRQYFWCLFLFRLVRELEPTIAIELGTSLGISAAYQGSALELNQQGRLMTLEGDATLAKLSAGHLAELGLTRALVVPGLFEATLERVLEDNRPIDFSFVDAGKRYGDMNRALATLKPYLVPGAVVVIDDIHWSAELAASWHTVRHDPAVQTSIDLEAMGVLIIDPGAEDSTHIELPIG
ncbi:MAG: class I SAM-dependent methyltransferase [Acidobacteriota bacterium]